jgi:hypothetical protein
VHRSDQTTENESSGGASTTKNEVRQSIIISHQIYSPSVIDKDNDLRCRVNKRAQKLFGMEPSDHKRKWVDEEFERRRAKRQEKERRKQAVNGALAATPSSTPTTTTEEVSDPATISQLQHKLLQHYQSLFGMDQQDSEKTKNSTAALVAALQNPQLLQLSQLLAQTVTAGSVQPLSPPHQPSPTSASSSSSLPPPSTTETPNTSLITSPDDPAFLTLQHPPATTTKNDDDTHLDQSKIDLAAAEIMKQFTSHALGTPLADSATDSTTEEITSTPTTEKKNDYPMDAVMTLMELNAGWRP